jgi:hypothetical protein
MAIKYIIIFQSESLQNLPKLGFLVWRQTIWHTLIVSCPLSHWKEVLFWANVFYKCFSTARRFVTAQVSMKQQPSSVLHFSTHITAFKNTLYTR